MLRFDALGGTCVSFGGAPAEAQSCAARQVAECTLPLVVHDFGRARVLGTATLLRGPQGPLLLTAAHLFDAGVRLGNLLAPLDGGGFLGLAGARLACAAGADIALIDCARVTGAARLFDGRRIAALPRGARRRAHRAERERCVLVCGYPAQLSRFERGWLAARRLEVFTAPRADDIALPSPDRLFDYGRVADRSDGIAIHTPALEGMSGAGIWALEADAPSGVPRFTLTAVQSAYLHGRHLRGHTLAAAHDILAA